VCLVLAKPVTGSAGQTRRLFIITWLPRVFISRRDKPGFECPYRVHRASLPNNKTEQVLMKHIDFLIRMQTVRTKKILHNLFDNIDILTFIIINF